MYFMNKGTPPERQAGQGEGSECSKIILREAGILVLIRATR
jgi:hypothetical protein